MLSMSQPEEDNLRQYSILFDVDAYLRDPNTSPSLIIRTRLAVCRVNKRLTYIEASSQD